MERPLIERPDVAHCLSVARASASNLWLVGRALPPGRRALFATAYASMRVIDDYIDDDFLMRPAEERAAARGTARQVIEHWRAACAAAIEGREADAGDAPFDPRLYSALAATIGRSDLGSGPWQAMADAMLRDAEETPFRAWADFMEYCEGATVAPAAVFLYVLAATETPTGDWQGALPAQPADCARDMAVFCYLVHIMRDLREDAEQSPLLLTIPEEILRQHGIDRQGLAEEVLSGRDERAVSLVGDLAERAAAYRARTREWRERLEAGLPAASGRLLRALLAVYEALHDAILADPGSVLAPDRARATDLKESMRRRVLRAAGLEA